MILCCGDALIDMIPTPTEGGAVGFVPHSGGAVFNTARALGRLGVPTGFLAGLSTDMFGQQLLDDLHQSQVTTDLAIRSDLPCTLAFVQLQDGQASYTFYDENSAGRSLHPEQLPEIPADISAIFFGGISLVSEPCADFYAALAERETAGRTIMLDPNIRPGFISDEGRYRARLNRLMAAADIVKVSDEDLHWIFPGAGSADQKVAQLLQQGPAMVVLTEGRAGASLWRRDQTPVSAPAQEAEVVDTVGAGDCFNAGFLAHLHSIGRIERSALSGASDADLHAALTYGGVIAAVAVSRAGANPPWPHELNATSD